MPLDVSAVLRDRLERLYGADPVLWLYEVEVPSTPLTRYRFAANTEPIPFGTNPATGDPHIYYPASVTHEGIEQDREGTLPEITITAAASPFDIAHEIDRYGGLDDAPVTIILTSALELNNPARAVRWQGRVLRCSVDAGPDARVSIVVASHNLYAAHLPPFRYPGTRCGWAVFGSVGCGYVIPPTPTNAVGGGFDFCPKLLDACVERGQDEAARGVPVRHPLRMRMFRGTR